MVEVEQIYHVFLHRDAGSVGLDAFTKLLETGCTVERVRAIVMSSPEYFANRAGGSNAGFLNNIFIDVLGHSIDPLIEARLLPTLNRVSRENFAFRLVGSRPAEQVLVESFYNKFLHRTAESAGK